MKPLERYASDIAAGLVSADEDQWRTVARFEELYDELVAARARRDSIASRIRLWLGSRGSTHNPRGIYLWGGVGRGKTYLMDLFYDCLPVENKLRTHFHRFMQQVHEGLTRLQGRKNPLDEIADEVATAAGVLCFDEFFILDIGDAMILAGLLEALFARGVTLVTTSNIHPDELYKDGLQRSRFLPAIELIKQHTRIVELDSPTDYRLRSLSQATLYHAPIDAATDGLLEQCFFDLAPDRSSARQGQPVPILGRAIPSRFCADDVAWFGFDALCDGPRSAFDYVELARLFHAVILSDVPILDERRKDQARRFVNLIDELYDRRVKLIVSAAAPIHELYRGESLSFEFERTRSRLIEMQSHEYLSSGHRA